MAQLGWSILFLYLATLNFVRHALASEYSLNGYDNECIGTRDNTVRLMSGKRKTTIRANTYRRGLSLPDDPAYCKIIMHCDNPNRGIRVHFNHLHIPCQTYAELDVMMYGDVGMKRFFCTNKMPKDYFSDSSEFMALLTFWNTPVDYKMVEFEFTVECIDLSMMPHIRDKSSTKVNGTISGPPLVARNLLPGYFGSIVAPVVAIICLVCLVMGFARICHLCRIRGVDKRDCKRETNLFTVLESLMRRAPMLNDMGSSTTNLHTSGLSTDTEDTDAGLQNNDIDDSTIDIVDTIINSHRHVPACHPRLFTHLDLQASYSMPEEPQLADVVVPKPPAYEEACGSSAESRPPSYDEVIAMSSAAEACIGLEGADLDKQNSLPNTLGGDAVEDGSDKRNEEHFQSPDTTDWINIPLDDA